MSVSIFLKLSRITDTSPGLCVLKCLSRSATVLGSMGEALSAEMVLGSQVLRASVTPFVIRAVCAGEQSLKPGGGAGVEGRVPGVGVAAGGVGVRVGGAAGETASTITLRR